MSSQCTSCIEGFSFDLNHWPYGGTWAYTDTGVHNEQPVSEVVVVNQTIGHIGENGYIHTHEFTMDTNTKSCSYDSINWPYWGTWAHSDT